MTEENWWTTKKRCKEHDVQGCGLCFKNTFILNKMKIPEIFEKQNEEKLIRWIRIIGWSMFFGVLLGALLGYPIIYL